MALLLLLRPSVPATAGTEGGDARQTHATHSSNYREQRDRIAPLCGPRDWQDLMLRPSLAAAAVSSSLLRVILLRRAAPRRRRLLLTFKPRRRAAGWAARGRTAAAAAQLGRASSTHHEQQLCSREALPASPRCARATQRLLNFSSGRESTCLVWATCCNTKPSSAFYGQTAADSATGP